MLKDKYFSRPEVGNIFSTKDQIFDIFWLCRLYSLSPRLTPMLSWKSNHREGVSGQARLCPTFIHNNRCQARTGCRHSRSLRWTELASGHMEGSPYSRFPPPSPPPVARIRPPLRPVLLFEGEEKYYFGDSTNCFSSLCSAWSLGHKG